jgi:pimeloyl-ACP methyl ester carboxylesterase
MTMSLSGYYNSSIRNTVVDLYEFARAAKTMKDYCKTNQRATVMSAAERALGAPTMVVWNSHDPTATPEEGKQMADMIPNSKFIVMNRCGHWPQFEGAEQFNRLHIEFFLTGK